MTDRVVARIRIGPPTGRFAVDTPIVGGSRVLAIGSWTRNGVLTGKRGLVRIDSKRNRPESLTPLPSGALTAAFGKGSLWVARVGGSSVERIEAATGIAVGRLAANDVRMLAFAGSQVWMATRGGTIRQIRTP